FVSGQRLWDMDWAYWLLRSAMRGAGGSLLPNQIAGANRRPPWASATALRLRLSAWLSRAGPQAAVAQLSRSATRPCHATLDANSRGGDWSDYLGCADAHAVRAARLAAR